MIIMVIKQVFAAELPFFLFHMSFSFLQPNLQVNFF